MELIQNLPYPSIERVLEVTAFEDEATAKAAIETLKWLDQGAPHKFNGFEGDFRFDMKKFIDTYAGGCGTACCIAGAISMYKRGGVLEGRSYRMSVELNEEFGTVLHGRDELSKLFYPYNEFNQIETKSPEQAASALREYLFTGKTNWND